MRGNLQKTIDTYYEFIFIIKRRKWGCGCIDRMFDVFPNSEIPSEEFLSPYRKRREFIGSFIRTWINIEVEVDRFFSEALYECICPNDGYISNTNYRLCDLNVLGSYLRAVS